jgi:histidine triad (HIT) family protein
MPLTPEEQEEIRVQLREQVAHLPEEKKAQALQQIENLSPDALEELVKQSQTRTENEGEEKKSIFRMIVEKKIPSNTIEETAKALAVLDINPISKGHTLIIPKKAVGKATKLSPALFQLAKRIGKRITKKLGAKTIEITTQEAFGETIIHVIPLYEKQLSLSSPRTKVSPEELTAHQQKIAKGPRKQSPIIPKKRTEQEERKIQRRRIP